MPHMELRTKLLRALADHQMNKAELARRIDEHASAVGHYCSGERVPTTEIAVKIARVLNLPLDYLLRDEIDEPLQVITGLTEREQELVRMMRTMGPERAYNRLLGVGLEEVVSRLVESLDRSGMGTPAGETTPADLAVERDARKARGRSKRPG